MMRVPENPVAPITRRAVESSWRGKQRWISQLSSEHQAKKNRQDSSNVIELVKALRERVEGSKAYRIPRCSFAAQQRSAPLLTGLRLCTTKRARS
jgi:hypothetical protein